LSLVRLSADKRTGQRTDHGRRRHASTGRLSDPRADRRGRDSVDAIREQTRLTAIENPTVVAERERREKFDKLLGEAGACKTWEAREAGLKCVAEALRLYPEDKQAEAEQKRLAAIEDPALIAERQRREKFDKLLGEAGACKTWEAREAGLKCVAEALRLYPEDKRAEAERKRLTAIEDPAVIAERERRANEEAALAALVDRVSLSLVDLLSDDSQEADRKIESTLSLLPATFNFQSHHVIRQARVRLLMAKLTKLMPQDLGSPPTRPVRLVIGTGSVQREQGPSLNDGGVLYSYSIPGTHAVYDDGSTSERGLWGGTGVERSNENYPNRDQWRRERAIDGYNKEFAELCTEYESTITKYKERAEALSAAVGQLQPLVLELKRLDTEGRAKDLVEKYENAKRRR
jgi:hypothetical protein